MHGIVSFSTDTKKEKYATRVEREEMRELRHGRMSRSERFREWSAKVVRMILLFGVPVMLSLVMFIVLASIYIVRPYALTRDFTRTTCQVTGHQILNTTSASCSAGTDPFQPCVKIQVSYATGEKFQNGVIMENEQSLVNCNPCSYTFGRHGLLHEYQDACESWKEHFDPSLCVKRFLLDNGIVGDVHPCFFNPHNLEQVVRVLVIDENMVIHALSWPILLCCIYFVAWGFVCYDSKQGKLIDKCIQAEIAYKQKMKQMERFHANEWKKQRLGQTLGIRSPIQSPNTFLLRTPKDIKRMSASLPSLTDLNHKKSITRPGNFTESTDDLDNDENTNFDLRHLDLAVSQQNINDLTTTYPYIETPPPLTYENVNAAFPDDQRIGVSRLTVPRVLPMSTFRRNTKDMVKSSDILYNGASLSFSAADHHKINTRRAGTFVSSVSFSPTSNGSIFYQQRQEILPQDMDAVSEDEIDGYYSVERRWPRLNAQNAQTFVLSTSKNESRV